MCLKIVKSQCALAQPNIPQNYHFFQHVEYFLVSKLSEEWNI